MSQNSWTISNGLLGPRHSSFSLVRRSLQKHRYSSGFGRGHPKCHSYSRRKVQMVRVNPKLDRYSTFRLQDSYGNILRGNYYPLLDFIGHVQPPKTDGLHA